MSKINRNPECRKKIKKMALIEYLQYGEFRFILLGSFLAPFVIPYLFCMLEFVIWPDLIAMFIFMITFISIALVVGAFSTVLKNLHFCIAMVLILISTSFSLWFLVVNRTEYYEHQINALYEQRQLQNEGRDSLDVRPKNGQNDIIRMMQGIMIGLSIK